MKVWVYHMGSALKALFSHSGSKEAIIWAGFHTAHHWHHRTEMV